jgi:hypothetical protein
MEDAWEEVKERGGPANVRGFGETCDECEAWAVDKWPLALTHFAYEGQTNAGVVSAFGFGIGMHCWGEVRSRNSGKTIGTIDFWKGGSEYWASGTGTKAFGWSPSKDNLLIQAMGSSANSGAPPFGYMGSRNRRP